ncbi:hypothetical protein F5Y12DRAFT_750327, partial [Xylaria sp. FL1777]
MPRIQGSAEVVRDIADDDEIATGTTMVVKTQHIISIGVTSCSKIEDATSIPPIQDRITSVSVNQKSWVWHGSWAPGDGPWSVQRDTIPTTCVTLASTVTYTEPHSSAQMSQSSSIDPTASEIRTASLDISGPAAAGIGVGTSVGLLGLYLAAVYFYRKRSNRHRHQSLVQTSGNDKLGDGIWPPYPYSASNEWAVELSAIRQSKEMCAETRVRGKDVSNHSDIVELEEGGLVVRESRVICFESSGGYQDDTRLRSHGMEN